MIEAFGVRIPATAIELLQEPCALIVWDMQEGIGRKATNLPTIVPNINRLRSAARARGVPVIYSQHYTLPFERDDRAWLRSLIRRSGGDPSRLQPSSLQGSPGWQFMPETAPDPNETVLAKHRPSFFVGTPLLDVLKARQIDVIVMTGVSTDRGVLTTAREAQVRGVFTVVVSDGVGAFSDEAHTRGLEDIRAIADVCDTSEVLAAWRG